MEKKNRKSCVILGPAMNLQDGTKSIANKGKVFINWKINKWKHHLSPKKMLNFSSAKDSVNKVRNQTTNWEKYLQFM